MTKTDPFPAAFVSNLSPGALPLRALRVWPESWLTDVPDADTSCSMELLITLMEQNWFAGLVETRRGLRQFSMWNSPIPLRWWSTSAIFLTTQWKAHVVCALEDEKVLLMKLMSVSGRQGKTDDGHSSAKRAHKSIGKRNRTKGGMTEIRYQKHGQATIKVVELPSGAPHPK